MRFFCYVCYIWPWTPSPGRLGRPGTKKPDPARPDHAHGPGSDIIIKPDGRAGPGSGMWKLDFMPMSGQAGFLRAWAQKLGPTVGPGRARALYHGFF